MEQLVVTLFLHYCEGYAEGYRRARDELATDTLASIAKTESHLRAMMEQLP